MNTPFDRNFKRKPEQFINSLNKMARDMNKDDASKWIYNQDNTKVIVLGIQPSPPTAPGTFGIRAYDVFGDRLQQTAVIL